jgi:hypothetical protein
MDRVSVPEGMPTAFLSMVRRRRMMMMMMMMMPSVELLQAAALVGPVEMKKYVSCGCETAQGEQRTWSGVCRVRSRYLPRETTTSGTQPEADGRCV